MDLHSYILIWISIIGLCLGSFYNVVILRSLSNESIVFPPSKCPKCNHKLYWWHNIPVLSYILLRGKCYFCKEHISLQYPIIELITMLFFILSFLKFGISYTTLFAVIWVSCLIIMTVTDIKERVIDCNIAIFMGISGLLYNYINYGLPSLTNAVLGILVGVLILEAVAWSGFLFTKSRAMGEGDTYIAGAFGAIIGFPNIIQVLLYSLLASLIFIIPVFFYNKYKNGNKITCLIGLIFALAIFAYYAFSQNIFILMTVIVSGILLAFFTMKGIGKEENRNYLPFAPALTAGMLYYIFLVLN